MRKNIEVSFEQRNNVLSGLSLMRLSSKCLTPGLDMIFAAIDRSLGDARNFCKRKVKARLYDKLEGKKSMYISQMKVCSGLSWLPQRKCPYSESNLQWEYAVVIQAMGISLSCCDQQFPTTYRDSRSSHPLGEDPRSILMEQASRFLQQWLQIGSWELQMRRSSRQRICCIPRSSAPSSPIDTAERLAFILHVALLYNIPKTNQVFHPTNNPTIPRYIPNTHFPISHHHLSSNPNPKPTTTESYLIIPHQTQPLEIAIPIAIPIAIYDIILIS